MEVKVLLSHGPFDGVGCERVGDPPSADEHPLLIFFFSFWISPTSCVVIASFLSPI